MFMHHSGCSIKNISLVNFQSYFSSTCLFCSNFYNCIFNSRNHFCDHDFLLVDSIGFSAHGLHATTSLSYEIQNSARKKYTSEHRKSHKGKQKCQNEWNNETENMTENVLSGNGQLFKKKFFEPFRSCLLNSTANPAQFGWKWAGLAVLFSR